MSRETVKVDWRDMKSIASAERKKARLENEGWNLEKTVAGLNTATIYYVKRSKP